MHKNPPYVEFIYFEDFTCISKKSQLFPLQIGDQQKPHPLQSCSTLFTTSLRILKRSFLSDILVTLYCILRLFIHFYSNEQKNRCVPVCYIHWIKLAQILPQVTLFYIYLKVRILNIYFHFHLTVFFQRSLISHFSNNVY